MSSFYTDENALCKNFQWMPTIQMAYCTKNCKNFKTWNLPVPFNPLYTYGFFFLVWYNKLGIVHCTNSVDPDEMPHYVAFDLGVHCLPKSRLPNDPMLNIWLNYKNKFIQEDNKKIGECHATVYTFLHLWYKFEVRKFSYFVRFFFCVK